MVGKSSEWIENKLKRRKGLSERKTKSKVCSQYPSKKRKTKTKNKNKIKQKTKTKISMILSMMILIVRVKYSIKDGEGILHRRRLKGRGNLWRVTWVDSWLVNAADGREGGAMKLGGWREHRSNNNQSCCLQSVMVGWEAIRVKQWTNYVRRGKKKRRK